MDLINSLPDLVLVNIFENLSPRMIKCCALVCKRWDNIIGSSKEVMGMFKLNLEVPIRKIKEAKSLQRKHQTVQVKNIGESLDVISHHNLQSLHISHSWNQSPIKLSLLIDALNKLPSLKILKAYGIKFEDDISGTRDDLKVNINLEELECRSDYIHIFNCYSIKKFATCFENQADVKELQAIEFIKQQDNLEIIDIIGDVSQNFFFQLNAFEHKFCLKKLSFNAFEPFQHYQELKKFLNQHKSSLKSLKLYFSTEPEFGIELIHKYVLENLISLQSLCMGHYKDESKIAYNDLHATQITNNLKKLRPYARSFNMNENRRFYDMFKNLKNLYFDGSDSQECPDGELLQCISERCVNIEIFELTAIEEVNTTNIYFPKLKVFSTEMFYKEKYLAEFIDRHSQTLEEISILDTDDFTHLTAKAILKCQNLKYLYLSFCSYPSFFFLGMMGEFSFKTKTFTLCINKMNNSYKFPDDKAIWDEDIKKLQTKFSKNCCKLQ